jgi:hypothetical protein
VEMKTRPHKEVRALLKVLSMVEKKVHEYRIEVRNIYIKEIKKKSEYHPVFSKSKANRDSYLDKSDI